MSQGTTEKEDTVVSEAFRARVQPASTGAALWVALLASSLPFLFAVLLRAGDGPGLEADDYGQYLMHAEALAEGRAYGDIGYIFTSHRRLLGPALAPPGLPLTLAPVLAVFGRNPVAIKAVLLGFAVAFILLAGRYFAMRDDRRLGLAVTLLCGLSAAMVHASTRALSDIPFAAAAWAVILLYDRPGPWGAGRIAWATFFIGWTILFRTIGVVLLPAVLLYAALRHREHGLRPAVPALILVAAGVLVLLMNPGQLPGLDVNPARIAIWLRVNHWGLDNVLAYRLSVFASHLYPFPWSGANDLYHVLSTCLMLVGLGAWLRYSWKRFGVVFAAVYGGALLLLPFAQGRYMWPLFPILIFGLVNGVRLAASRLAPARPAWGARPALVFSMALAALGVVHVASQPRRQGLAEFPEVQQVFLHLSTLAQREEVRVVFYKPRAFAWESGIPAMPTFSAAPDATLAELTRKRITHIVLGDEEEWVGGGRPSLRRAIEAMPHAFSLEFRNPAFAIYRVLPLQSDTTRPAPPG